MYQSMCGDFDDKEGFYETVEKYTPPTTELKAFYVFVDGEDGEDYPGLLIFAKTDNEAIDLAMEHAVDDGDWWEISPEDAACLHFEKSGKLATQTFGANEAHLLKYADQENLIKNKPHIGTPKCCEECNIWGNKLNRDDLCWDCYYE